MKRFHPSCIPVRRHTSAVGSRSPLSRSHTGVGWHSCTSWDPSSDAILFVCIAAQAQFSSSISEGDGRLVIVAEKSYRWIATVLPFLPEPYTESEDGEESKQYVTEGRRLVSQVLHQAGQIFEVGHSECACDRLQPDAACML
jgi:hypothetical protein